MGVYRKAVEPGLGTTSLVVRSASSLWERNYRQYIYIDLFKSPFRSLSYSDGFIESDLQ